MSWKSIASAVADFRFRLKRCVLGPRRVRRTRLYCIGTSKSGTHSIAALFSPNVRAQHECGVLSLIQRILDRHAGHITEDQFDAWLRARDKRLSLELDSSHVNVDILDSLLREFPDGRYLLTIRDCYSWFNSVTNQSLRFRGQLDPRWQGLAAFRAGPGPFVHAPEESVLKQLELLPLENYLRRWARHNDRVLSRVPAHRLLVVRTDQIARRAFEIADFAGLPRHAVRTERAHAFRNQEKQDVVRRIDRVFLERKVEEHCRPLMTRFFPEIKSLDDAALVD